MGKGEIDALKTRLIYYAEALFFGGEYKTKDVVNGISDAIKTIDTLAAELESLKQQVPWFEAACTGLRYQNPMACGQVVAVHFNGVRMPLPPEPQGVGGDTQEGNADD